VSEPRQSAGLLLFRRQAGALEVLLAHPGGPFWAHKDQGAWSIPKGEFEPGETAFAAARREFAEETGAHLPVDPTAFRPLGQVAQKSGKVVLAWALEGDLDPASAHSNTVEVEWPPRSGRRISVPEIDRVAWYRLEAAKAKINPAQIAFLDRLHAYIQGQQ
jgi:predicted NUDIX family NTP pyrophosphohydrolase